MKMICTIITTLGFLFAIGQECNCKENLLHLKTMIETDYPGYADKIANSDYNNFTDSLLVEAAKTFNEYECFIILKYLTGYFKDPHLLVAINNIPENRKRIQEIFSSIKPICINESKTATLKNWLPIEGIWQVKNQGTDYTVKIHKDSNGNYSGSIISADGIFWHPGQTKFIITGAHNNLYDVIFFLRDHTSVKAKAIYDSSGLLDMKTYGICTIQLN